MSRHAFTPETDLAAFGGGVRLKADHLDDLIQCECGHGTVAAANSTPRTFFSTWFWASKSSKGPSLPNNAHAVRREETSRFLVRLSLHTSETKSARPLRYQRVREQFASRVRPLRSPAMMTRAGARG